MEPRMRIDRVTAPSILPLSRALLANLEGPSPVSIPVRLLEANKPATAVASDEKSQGHLAALLAMGTPLLAEGVVYKGGTYLLSGLNDITVPQFAMELQKVHLVQDPTLAHNKAEYLLGLVQNKEISSIIIGSTAGIMTFIFVDVVRPTWPLWIKIAIGVTVAAAIIGAIYFGLNDKPVAIDAPASPVSQPK
jgi:hypothetical protein